jgi:hypothetical protein
VVFSKNKEQAEARALRRSNGVAGWLSSVQYWLPERFDGFQNRSMTEERLRHFTQKHCLAAGWQKDFLGELISCRLGII